MPTQEVPTPTPFQPQEPTPNPENTPKSSPIPTEIPVDPFRLGELDLAHEGELTLDVVLDGQDLRISLVLRPGPLGLPGENTGAAAIDGYPYVLLYLHSGEHGRQPLEAEPLRRYIEGTRDRTITDEAYVLEKLRSLEGVTFTLTQAGVQESFEIYGAAKIPHEAKPIFDLNDLSAVEVVIQYGIGSPERFEYFKENRGILLTFCGWGPEDASRDPQSPDYRYTYSQYVLGLRLLNH